MAKKLHGVEWTTEKIGDFWSNVDTIIEMGVKKNDYFTLLNGRAVLSCVKKKVGLLNKQILDYGCGLGYICELIIQDGTSAGVYGCDLSSESVSIVNKKLSGKPLFKEAFSVSSENITRYEGFFDVVLLTEVVEHLDDRDLSVVCSNIKVLLKPEGKIFITTPNNEDLKSSMVVCPDCGCYYHKVQHIRSWSKETLTAYMEHNGFNTNSVLEIDFDTDMSVKVRAFNMFRKIVRMVEGRSGGENLIYIGTKK